MGISYVADVGICSYFVLLVNRQDGELVWNFDWLELARLHFSQSIINFETVNSNIAIALTWQQ
jgi:hypothetical protein